MDELEQEILHGGGVTGSLILVWNCNAEILLPLIVLSAVSSANAGAFLV